MKSQKKAKSLSLASVVCLSINCAVGTGVLALPMALYKAGIVPALCILVFFGVCSFFSSEMITEAASHSAALIRNQRVPGAAPDFSLRTDDDTYLHTNDTARLLQGRVGGWLSTIMTFLYIAIAQIFCVSTGIKCFTTVIPIIGLSAGLDCSGDASSPDYPSGCNKAYYVWLAIFLAVVLPLCLVKVTDAAGIQLCFTIHRWLTVMTVIVACWWSLASGPAIPGEGQRTKAPFIAEPMYWGLNHWAGVAYLIPSTAFAYMYHYSQTVFIEPLRNKEKNARKFSLLLNLIALLIYVTFGLSGAFVFGKNVPELIIFAFHHWAGGSNWSVDTQPAWAKAISVFLLLYPALSPLAMFPINSQMLAMDIYEWIAYAVNAIRRRRGATVLLSQDMLTEPEEDPATQTFFQRLFPYDKKNDLKPWVLVVTRIGVAVASVVLALLLRSAQIIIKISGVFGVYVVFFTPALSVLCGRRRIKATFGQRALKQCPYSHFTGHLSVSIIMLVVGALCIALTIASTFNLIH